MCVSGRRLLRRLGSSRRPTGELRPSASTGRRTSWRTADPADHGFDEDELAEIERLVADSYPNVRSIVIVRDGYLVYERYWHGLERRGRP